MSPTSEQLSQLILSSFLWCKSGITYANMMSIKRIWKQLKVGGVDFTTSPNQSYLMENLLHLSSVSAVAARMKQKVLLGHLVLKEFLNSLLAGNRWYYYHLYEKENRLRILFQGPSKLRNRCKQGKTSTTI